MDLKRCGRLLGDKESFTVVIWRQEDVIIQACVDRLGVRGFERHHGRAVVQLAGAGVLEPVFRRLDRVQRYVAGSVGPFGNGGMPTDRAAANQVATHKGDSSDEWKRGHRRQPIRI